MNSQLSVDPRPCQLHWGPVPRLCSPEMYVPRCHLLLLPTSANNYPPISVLPSNTFSCPWIISRCFDLILDCCCPWIDQFPSKMQWPQDNKILPGINELLILQLFQPKNAFSRQWNSCGSFFLYTIFFAKKTKQRFHLWIIQLLVMFARCRWAFVPCTVIIIFYFFHNLPLKLTWPSPAM